MDAVRKCLLQALQAIARARPRVDFKTGFLFLMRYLPRCAGRDKELAQAFEAANAAMVDATEKRRPVPRKAQDAR